MPTSAASYSDAAARSRYAGFVRSTLIANLAVIVWGAYVRASGSGAGCGSHWPLCNGEIIPRAPSTATLIELSHRLTSGVALILVVAMVVLAWRRFPSGSPVRRYAAWSLAFMVGEAAVGAGLVLFELVADNQSMARAMFMAVHLVNTFLLLGAMTLTLHCAEGRPAPAWRGLFRGRGWLLGPALLGVLAIGASGAIAALGDTLFPADSLSQALTADLSPTSHLLIQLRVLHPVIAIVVGVVLLVVVMSADDRAPAQRWARWLSLAVLVQIALGFVNLALLAPVPVQLLHLLIADLLWMVLVRLAAEQLTPAKYGASSAGNAILATKARPIES